MEQVQAAPTPATIFSLFYEGKFVTTDISLVWIAVLIKSDNRK